MAIGVIIDDSPDLVLFAATRDSATTAQVTSYQYGQGTVAIAVTGRIQLLQDGGVLNVTVDSPLGSEQCSFSQYSGSFIGVVGG